MTQTINMTKISLFASNQIEFQSQLTDNILQAPVHQSILAQEVSDPDVMGQMGDYLKNFVETGQVWALLVGIVLGYVFRGIIGR